MPQLIQHLTAQELHRKGQGRPTIDLEPYRAILSDLDVGEGAEVALEDGEAQRVVKRRFSTAASERQLSVRWLRAAPGQLRFRLEAGEERPEATPPPSTASSPGESRAKRARGRGRRPA